MIRQLWLLSVFMKLTKIQIQNYIFLKKWELEEITRDGTADKKVEPVIVEKTEPKIQFPLSQKVGNVDETKTFTLGVTESFTFKGNFGTTL